MEGAGKSIEDDDARAMREGLGTPATRAQIIEGLIFERYILREGKELIAALGGFADDAAAGLAFRSSSSPG